jgi:hypothetical protein
MNMDKNEAESYGKLDFQMILMLHIDRCNKQLSRLPHEVLAPNMNVPSGCTHDDIITSYSELVSQFEECLRPYHDLQYSKDRAEIKKDLPSFFFAKRLFGICMRLCDRRGYLLDKGVVQVSVEDVLNEDKIEVNPIAPSTDV